jgi:PadR family transcriptional regulator PadR
MPLSTSRAADPRIDLLQGTLDMLILRTLQWGPQHGYAIGQAIRSQSSEVLRVETGSLYPALQRLETRGWVVAEWRQSEANQRARFYKLTPKGKKQLSHQAARWREMVAAIGRIMNAGLAKE